MQECTTSGQTTVFPTFCSHGRHTPFIIVIKSISYYTCASAPTMLHTVPIFFIKLWHFKQQEPALRAHPAWNMLQQPLSAALSMMAYLWLWNAMVIIWGSAVQKGAVKRWWPLTAEWPLRTESCFLNILGHEGNFYTQVLKDVDGTDVFMLLLMKLLVSKMNVSK